MLGPPCRRRGGAITTQMIPGHKPPMGSGPIPTQQPASYSQLRTRDNSEALNVVKPSTTTRRWTWKQ